MKNAKFSDAQIMAILRQAENGVPVSELCREHGMRGGPTFSTSLQPT
jgi:putative transposase